MIEQRRLTEEELNRLIEEAPDTETRNLKRFLYENSLTAYEFFNNAGVDHYGLISNGRPIYLAVLTRSDVGRFEFWTVVNSNVKDIISLCKYCKRELIKWLKRYNPIYATMEKVNPENMKWVKWLGFRVDEESSDLITFKIERT